jgi:hypothetical protein
MAWLPQVGERVLPSVPVMGRLLSLVLGLAVVAFTAYYALTHLAGADRADPEGRSQPKAVLDNTRAATKRIEQDAQKRVDETLRKVDDTR